MAITKNRQSNESIANMAKKAFPDKQIAEIRSGKVSLVYVFCSAQCIYDKKDKSDYRDRKEHLVSEITPHGYRTVFFGNVIDLRHKPLLKDHLNFESIALFFRL